jgi:hypothetical protein
MNTKYCLMILVIIVFSNRLLANEKINSRLYVKYNNDTLIINIILNNDSDSSIYIQTENWEINGNEKSNRFLYFPINGYLINTFWYYPDSYSGMYYRTEASNSPEFSTIPKLKQLKSKDSLNISVKFKVKINSIDLLRFEAILPYFNDNIFNVLKQMIIGEFTYDDGNLNVDMYNKISPDNKYLFIELENKNFDKAKYSELLFKTFIDNIQISGIIQK